MTMLCSHMILVSTPLGLHLYRIPDFGSDASSHSDIAHPLAVYIQGKSEESDKTVWDSLCLHYDGRLATYTFTEEEEALLILPCPGQSEDEFVRHVIDGPCSMGNSRAIGCKDFVDMQPMELQGFTHFTSHNRHVGYVRLERIKAPDPSRPVLVSLPGQDGRVEDLSWDEESGRICVIFSPFGDRSTRNMLMVDLI
jgi:hypothetical protein